MKINIELRRFNLTRNIIKQLIDATIDEMLTFQVMGWVMVPYRQQSIKVIILYDADKREIRKIMMPKSIIPVKCKVSEDMFLKIIFDDGFGRIFPRNFSLEESLKIQNLKIAAEQCGQIFTPC